MNILAATASRHHLTQSSPVCLTYVVHSSVLILRERVCVCVCVCLTDRKGSFPRIFRYSLSNTRFFSLSLESTKVIPINNITLQS